MCTSPHGTPFIAVQCSTIQCSTIQCSAIQQSVVQCIAMQCNADYPVEERLVSGRRGCALQCNFINRSSNPVQWSKIETSAKSVSLQEKSVSIPMCALCRLLCTDCPIQWRRRGECPRGGGGRSHLGDSLLILLGPLSEFHQDDSFSLSLSLWKTRFNIKLSITECQSFSKWNGFCFINLVWWVNGLWMLTLGH